MRIDIDDKKTIADIQHEFNSAYPYLKLDFHAKPSRPGGVHSRKHVRNPGTRLAECRSTHTEGKVTIVPDMTVFSLLQNLNDVYGLAARVLRKSGKTWIPTTLTEDWTLKEQNVQGEFLSRQGKESTI